MNLPNTLTALRFVIVPIFGYVLYNGQYQAAIFLFLLGGLTDVLDGYIARKFNLITSFGKLADPIADKLMQITALVILTMQSMIPVIILIVVLAKEIFMGAGSILLYRKENHVVSANWYGKMATVIFYFAIITTIVMEYFGFKKNGWTINLLMGAAVLLALFAFFMYSMEYRKIRNKT